MSLHPRSIEDWKRQQERAQERLRKRVAKRKTLGWRGQSRALVVKQLDHLFSLFIRRRDRGLYAGRCVICQIRPIEHCFHWITRAAFSVRWDAENACGSCRGCNCEETFRPIKYRNIHVQLIGLEAREALEAKAKEPSDFSTADLIKMRDDLKSKLQGGS